MNPPQKSPIAAIVFSIIAVLLFLCVIWNIVMPESLTWLGFWKGVGVFFLAIAFASAAASSND